MSVDQQDDSGGQSDTGQEEHRRLIGKIGPLEVDVPKAVGYYGGISLAVALGILEWPIGAFIAAVPLFKMLQRPNSSTIEWIAGEVLEGSAQPVGGSGQPVVRTHSARGGNAAGAAGGTGRLQSGMWSIVTEARQIASR